MALWRPDPAHPPLRGAMAEIVFVIGEDGIEGARKTIRADQRNNPAFVALLEAEIEAHRRARHPALLRALDSGPGWLVTERASGSASERSLWDADSLSLLLDRIESALGELHARGVIHRDVKASNVLMTPRGWVLADLGAALLEGRPDPAPMLGSPQWMSRDRLDGAKASPASDRYALGMLGWEIAAGELPYPARFPELRAAIDRGLPELRPRFPVPAPLRQRIYDLLSGP